jgi:DNA-binding transcriptional ArsR family regulator
MRPLYHPALKDITVQGILYALSDPIRVQIYAELARQDCAKNCSSFNIGPSALPKSTLSQHFKILREAGLVYSERCGVELHNRTRCSELAESFGPMIKAIVQAYEREARKK